jgi:hypothetical protein
MSKFRSETPARRSKTTRAVVACEGLEGRQLLTGAAAGGFGLPPFAGMGMGMGMGMGGPWAGPGGSAPAAQVGGQNAAGASAAQGFPGHGMFGRGQGPNALGAPGMGGAGWSGMGGGTTGGAPGSTSSATATPPPALPAAVQTAIQTLRTDWTAITGTHRPTHASVGALMDDHDAVAAGTLTGTAADAKIKADQAAILTSAGLTADQVTKIQADQQAVDDAFKAAGIDPKSFGPGRDHTPPQGQAPAQVQAQAQTLTAPAATTTTASTTTATTASTTPTTTAAVATTPATPAAPTPSVFMNRRANGLAPTALGANHARGGSLGHFARARRGPGAFGRGTHGVA